MSTVSTLCLLKKRLVCGDIDFIINYDNREILTKGGAMEPVLTASGVAIVGTTAKLLSPIINDIYKSAKEAGVAGFRRWSSRNFPSKLSKRVNSIANVKTLWKPDDVVSLKDFFHPAKIIINKDRRIINFVDEFDYNFILIEGIVGQGKSIFLRSLALNEIEVNGNKRIPVFLELKDIDKNNKISDLIARYLSTLDIDCDEGTFDFLCKTGKFVFFFDAFDEVEEICVKDVLLYLNTLAIKYPELKIVISSRPQHEIQKSTLFKRYLISEIVPGEYSSFLSKLKVDAAKSLDIRNAIKK